MMQGRKDDAREKGGCMGVRMMQVRKYDARIKRMMQGRKDDVREGRMM